MRSILVMGCGGAPAINFTRFIQSSHEKFFTVGTEIDKYAIYRSETDTSYYTPNEDVEIINKIVDKHHIKLIHAQPDEALSFISKHRDELNYPVFLPSEETVEICQDKFLSYVKWRSAKVKVPKTIKITSESELEKALQKIPCAWFRRSRGAFGKGSIPLNGDLELARAWMRYWGGGEFLLSERLPDPNKCLTWSAIYRSGELVVAQTRERLRWEFGNRTVSGVSGITGVARTASDEAFDELAEKAIHVIDLHPNGIFSLDCTYDSDGVPNPTEINIGRFFTTIDFFTKAGLNMPYIYVKTALNEEIRGTPKIWVNYPKKINPLPRDYYWIRGMDIQPKLIPPTEVNNLLEAP